VDMRKQLDNRWKQIDKFENSVKAYGEAKTTWRRKLSAKEGELEAIKVRRKKKSFSTLPLSYLFFLLDDERRDGCSTCRDETTWDE
jgi:hypothetical protein